MKMITLERRYQRFSPHFSTVLLLPGEDLYDFLHEVLSGIISVWEALMGEQYPLILEMSYTGRGRIDLAEQLTQTVYNQGVPPFIGKEKLHRAMTMGELHTLFYRLVCGETGSALLFWYLTACTPREEIPNEDHTVSPVSQLRRSTRCARTSQWRSRRCALSYAPRRSPGDDEPSMPSLSF